MTFIVTADADMYVHAVRLSMFGMTIMLLNYGAVFNGATRVLSQGWKLSWKGPTGHSKGRVANTQKTTLEMMVNPHVDGDSETLHHPKILQKTKKTTYWKPKE